ncbi:DUF6603 domain-containing protein [Haladaptatus sp. DFWS20]|uniref:DUF6603 domain-containing protein n=1 Tax=Haladaptatus sp. DFWS20 TaxID=3403467 RepID=UPI003EB7BB0E
MGITSDGSFTVAVGGLKELTNDVFTLRVDTIGFKVDGRRFAARISGELTPKFGDIDWPSFAVRELTIDSDGNVHLDGGWIDLRDQYSLDFFGFQFEITKFGLGKTDDGRKWIGLNGGIKLVEGLPMGASVEGLRITWDDEGDVDLSFDGVGIEFEIPNTLRFKGSVAYTKENGDNRFTGDLKLEFLALDVTIDAKAVFGQIKEDGRDTTYLGIYLSADIPSGIPLFATGLAIYGFAGLYGHNLEPDKGEEEAWYSLDQSNSWYHRPDLGVTDVTSKWAPKRGSFAVGAGMTFGTIPDNGRMISARVLLGVVLPGPIILLEGGMDMLSGLPELPEEGVEPTESEPIEEPLFRALIVLDNRAGTFLAGVEGGYKFAGGGELIDIFGGAELFFDFNDPTAWYFHLGKKEPREQRIRATVLSLFEANSYFMLDAKQLAFGSWRGYDKHYRFGPLKVDFEAWMEWNVLLSLQPLHVHGDLCLHGSVGLKAFGVGLKLSLDASLEADVFKPFHVLGQVRVKLKLPWPLPKLKATVTLEWGPRKNPPLLPHPLKEVAIGHQKVTTTWPLPRDEADNPDSGGTYPSLLVPDYRHEGLDGFLTEERPDSLDPTAPPPDRADLPAVPLDARPQLLFNRPVHARETAGIETGAAEITPEYELIGDPGKNEGPAEVRYDLTAVGLSKWVESEGSGEWVPVEDLYGSWGPVPKLPQQEGPEAVTNADPAMANTKLQLWSKNPFDFTRQSGGMLDDALDRMFPDYPCLPLPTCYNPGGVKKADFEISRIVLPESDEPARRIEHKSAAWPVFRLTDSTDRPEEPFTVVTQDERTFLRFRDTTSKGDGSIRLSITLPAPHKSVKVVVRPDVGIGPEESLKTLTASATDRNGDEYTKAWPDGETSLPEEIVVVLTSETSDIAQVEIEATGPGTLIPNPLVKDVFRQLAIGEICGASVPLSETVRTRYRQPETGETGEHEEERLRTFDDERKVIDNRQALVERWYDEDDIFEPYTTYRLEIDTRVTARGRKADGFTWKPDPIDLSEYAFFRTDGPPGVGVLSTPIGTHLPDEVRTRTTTSGGATDDVYQSELDDLTLYVDRTTPETIPSSGERPSLPRPVYRAYPVVCETNVTYVDLMYRASRRDLSLYLYDSNNRPVRDSEGRLLVIDDLWRDTGELFLDRSDRRWVTTVQNSRCLDVDEIRIPNDDVLAVVDDRHVLDPDTVYEARLVPLLLQETFSEGRGGWSEFAEGGSEIPAKTNWQVDHHNVISGRHATVSADGLQFTLETNDESNAGPPDLSEVVANVDTIRFTGDTARPSKTYLITAIDESSGSVTVDEQPNLETDEKGNVISDWRIAARGIARPTSSITSQSPGTSFVFTGDPTIPADHRIPPSQWTDYRVNLKLGSFPAPGETNSDEETIGVVFRHREGDHYRVTLSATGERRLVRVAGGQETVLASDTFTFERGHEYDIIVEALDRSFGVYVDDELVYQVEEDDSADWIDAGTVGIYQRSSLGVRLNSVRVDDYRKGAPSVYTFSFTTSHFANFIHHIHSYQDETWPAAVFPRGGGSIDDLLAAAQPVSVQPTAEERLAYDALLDQFDGVVNQNPPEVQVTRIDTEGEEGSPDSTVGFLLQSPEPINWTQTELAVSRVTRGVESYDSHLPEDVKLIEASGGDDEHVTLLLRERVDLSGYVIEHRDTRESDSDWETYYEFGEERPLPAGTRVRIHESSPAPTESGLVQRELGGRHRVDPISIRTLIEKHGGDVSTGVFQALWSLGSPTESSMRALVEDLIGLPMDNIAIRIRAPNGSVAHQRRFLSDESFEPVADLSVIRNRDGTGILLLPGTAVEPTSYRFGFVFQSPTLGRMSTVNTDDVSERTMIDIPWKTQRFEDE